MKFIVVPDLHGRTSWKTIKTKNFDKIVFLGDYMDSWDVDDDTMIANLADIIQFKKDNEDKVELLLGNHDVGYLYYPRFKCSGFRNTLLMKAHLLFTENKSLFSVAYEYKGLEDKKYLFTHAGVSTGWYGSVKEIIDGYLVEGYTLADSLNNMFNSRHYALLFEAGWQRGGPDEHGGIVWADYLETRKVSSLLDGYHQIVGHTPREDIETIGDNKTSITYCDVLDAQPKKFLKLEI